MSRKDEIAKMRPHRTRFDEFERPILSFKQTKKITKDSHKEECDINTIMKRYQKTGILPELIKQNPQYGDFSSVPDYQEAMNTVQLAQEQFAALGSHIRKRFNNDPQEFLAFAQDPKNSEEMVTLGLATKREPKAPDNAVPAPEPRVKEEPPKEGKKPSVAKATEGSQA